MKLMIDTQAAPLPGDVVLLHEVDGITYAACDETGQPQGTQDSVGTYISMMVGVVCGTFDYDTSDGAA